MDINLLEKSIKLFCQTIIFRVVKISLGGLAKEQITEVQLSCIRFVSLHPEPSIGEIAAGLVISNAASAKLVDRLVRKKVLTREEDPQDRRVLKIKLTPRGNELLNDINEIAAAQFAKILNRMASEELQALEIGLNGFLKAAIENFDQIDEVCLKCGWDHILNCPGNLLYRELTGKDKASV